MVDAVVIGAGPNGLVAANRLADAGWSVTVLEAEDEPGGAVRSGALTLPGFVHDRFSAFYPLGVASPIMRALDLEAHGLRWRRAEVPVAHAHPDGSPAHLCADLEATCAALDAQAPGDGAAWRALYGRWERLGPTLLEALFTPFPPVRAGARLARRLGTRGLLEFARFGVLPARRLGEEAFAGPAVPQLLAGNGLHADLAPDQPGSGLYGWVLCGLAQQVGFPAPEGGAGRLTAALVARLRAGGGRVECGRRVSEVVVERGRAVGVRTAQGDGLGARRAILADVSAPALYLELLARAHVPAAVLAALERFDWDPATFKVDWALRGPIPWRDEVLRRAGTVHVARGVDAMTRAMAELAQRRLPTEPFLVMGQYARTDPTRAPAGQETAWAYTHVPARADVDWSHAGERERFARRVEAQIEAAAPGFGDLVAARHITAPPDLQAADANLRAGALNGGTAQLHQQLVLRPVPGLGRPETPVAGLYLASASAHPGGGVHGACGANAARVALRQRGGPAARVAARASARAMGA